MQTPLSQLAVADPTPPKLIVGAVLFLFGALVNHIWTRWRQRLVTLTWTSDDTVVGMAGEDPSFGKIEVLYNGTPVKNIHFATITVRNDSNTDLRDLVLILAATESTRFFYSSGRLAGSSHYLVLNASFADTWNERTEAKASDDLLVYFWTHRDYDIPVLNRGQHATFTVFVTCDAGQSPTFSVTCDHPGVQVRNREPVVEIFGVPQVHAQVAGFLATLLLACWLIVSAAPTWAIGLGAWVLGLVTLLIGAGLVHLVRGVIRLLS